VEGNRLLVAGFPGNAKAYAEPMKIDWSPFFAITEQGTIR
jgi:hypothetical protein